QLFFRAGYSGRQDADDGIRMGFGFNYQQLKFDYALEEFGELGNHQKFSLTYSFGAPNEK
ncbi:MAG: hypothetical protein ACLFN5_07855, partial [bacterium]